MDGKATCFKCGNAIEKNGSDLSGKRIGVGGQEERSNSINGIKPQLSKDDSSAQTEYLTVCG